MTATAINSPKTGGEEHWPDGRVRKYGHSSDGSDNWDVWKTPTGGGNDTRPLDGAEAVTHSPPIDEHQTRKAKGSEKKKKKM